MAELIEAAVALAEGHLISLGDFLEKKSNDSNKSNVSENPDNPPNVSENIIQIRTLNT
jgi:hypothetical protein